MAERPSLRGQPRISQIRMIPLDGTKLQELHQTAQVFNKFSILLNQKMDREAAIDGARKGIKDGQDGQFKPDLLYAPTIRGQAYTQSALQEDVRVRDIETKTRLHDIAARNQFDPKKLRTEATAYIKKRAEQMPSELDSTVKNDFLLRSQLSIDTLAAGANAQAVSLEKIRKQAGILRYNRDRVIEIDRVGSNIFGETADVRVAALKEIFTIREDIAQSYQSTFQDEYGNVHPVFNPVQAQAAVEEFNKQFRKSAVQGWFLKQKSPIDALNTFSRGELKQEFVDVENKETIVFDPMGEASQQNVLAMTADEQKTMAGWMRGQVSAGISLKASIQAQIDKQREDAEDLLEIDFYNETDPSKRQVLGNALQVLSHDSKRVKRIREEMNELGPQGFTDPGVADQILIDIADGDLETPSQLKAYQLSNKDRREYAKMLLGRRNSSHITASRDFKSAVDLIYLELESDTLDGYSRRANKQKKSEAARLHGKLLRSAMEAEHLGQVSEFNPRAEVQKLLGTRDTLKGELSKIDDELADVREKIIEKSAEIKTTPKEDSGFLGFFKGYKDPEKDPDIIKLKEIEKILEQNQEELKRRTQQ